MWLSPVYPLDFLPPSLSLRADVALCGAGGFVAGKFGAGLETSAVEVMEGQTGGAEGVRANGGGEPCGLAAALNHRADIGAVHRQAGERERVPRRALEERDAAARLDADCRHIDP